MRLAFLFAETAQPTAADVVRAIAPERVMHLIDQTKRAPQVSPIADGALETEEIAHRERVGPKVATRRPVAGEPRAIGEASHQSLRGADVAHQAVFRSGAPGCNRICTETLRLTCVVAVGSSCKFRPCTLATWIPPRPYERGVDGRGEGFRGQRSRSRVRQCTGAKAHRRRSRRDAAGLGSAHAGYRRPRVEALLRRPSEELAARQVPAEGSQEADGARRADASEIRGESRQVHRGAGQADDGGDRGGRPREVQPGIREVRGTGQRLPRALRQALSALEGAVAAAAGFGPDASAEATEVGSTAPRKGIMLSLPVAGSL